MVVVEKRKEGAKRRSRGAGQQGRIAGPQMAQGGALGYPMPPRWGYDEWREASPASLTGGDCPRGWRVIWLQLLSLHEVTLLVSPGGLGRKRKGF